MSSARRYLIVEVRERHQRPGAVSDTGRLRRALHRFVEEQGLDCGDVVVRGDRKYNRYGLLEPFGEIAELYERVVGHARSREEK